MTDIPTIDAEVEPEYVGAHSAITNPTCQDWHGDAPEEMERCGAEATHTVVMYSGRLHEIAMCNDCGEPGDAADDRAWSGTQVAKTVVGVNADA